MSNICIIPARGGSKRIPKKNIKNFLGKPIIAYSIEAAIKSELFDEVMVSTDNKEIANIAESYGASIPFMRSHKNSNDFSTTADVLSEVIETYKNMGKNFDVACCLYPAAPLVTPEKLREGFKSLVGNNFDSVFPVVQFSSPIQRSYKLIDGKLSLNWPEHRNSRTQDVEPSFYDSGQFYWFSVNQYLESGDIITANCGGIEMSEIESQDIDNEVDWLLAEMKFQLCHRDRPVK